MLTPAELDALADAALAAFPLARDGVHGLSHWGRVLENGLLLAAATGADPRVVACFALLHDCRRADDGWDPDHGRRAAAFAGTLRGRVVHLGDADFALLETACALHADGLTEGELTVRVCWDADRLDLGRVGGVPDPEMLCMDAARDPAVIAWAHDRAVREAVPESVRAAGDHRRPRRPPRGLG